MSILPFIAVLLKLAGTGLASELVPCFQQDRDACTAAYSSAAASGDADARFDALANLGVIELENGNPKAAAEHFANAHALRPADAFTPLLDGWALFSQGRYKDASLQFEKIASVTSSPTIVSDAKIGSAMCLLALGKNDAAIEILQALYVKDPYTISLTAYLLGEAYNKLRRYPTAMTYYQQALSHDYRNYPAQLAQAQLYEKDGNNVTAWQLYASLNDMDPKDPLLAAKLKRLASSFKKESIDYLYYTRLKEPFQKNPRFTPSRDVAVALFSDRQCAQVELYSFDFIASSSFTIYDAVSGQSVKGKAMQNWTISFSSGIARILDSWGSVEYASRNPLELTLNDLGASVLIKNARGATIIGLDYGDRELRGKLTIVPSSTGMRLLDTLPLEDYLPGAVAAARPGSDDTESLKALAVVLRTKAIGLRAKNRAAGLGYDLCDSPAGIIYSGINREFPQAVEAVDSTAGEIFSSTQAIAVPDFHEACGGANNTGVLDSASAEEPNSPYAAVLDIIAAPGADLLCAPQDPTLWSSARWTLIIDAKQTQKRLAREFKIGKLKAVIPFKRNPAGRITTMRFKGSAGQIDVDNPEKILFLLSAGALRSNLFFIIPVYKSGSLDRLIVRGSGTGLGEGLCASGAEGMSIHGKTYRDILRHYFPAGGTTKSD